jgi:predicted transcriptional regulator YdeE
MVGITIAAGKYEVCTLEGKCPQNVLSAWQEIWDSDINRRYATDYDVYTPNFQSFEDSEVKIFLSVK